MHMHVHIAYAYASADAYAGANAAAGCSSAIARLLPLSCYPLHCCWIWMASAALQQPHTLMLLPTLAAPVLNHTPFAQRSTPQQAGHRTSTHWPLPPHGTGDPRTALQPREPCRPFGRLAMGYGGMDRCSGAPPLQLGWVTLGAGPSGEATSARARPGAPPPTSCARQSCAGT